MAVAGQQTCLCNSRWQVQSAPSTARVSSSFHGSPALLLSRPRLHAVRPQRLSIQNALPKHKKEETVANLCEKLSGSAVVVGVRTKGISVKKVTEFRRSLPEGVKAMMCKNTLMGVALEKVGGWGGLKECLDDDNMWVFVPEESIGAAVKAYINFEKSMEDFRQMPKEERGKGLAVPISGGCMESNYFDLEGFKKLEKLPTKQELIATIARLIKMVPTKVAIAVKQVPTKVAFAVKALADGDEDKSRLVGDVFPKPAAATE